MAVRSIKLSFKCVTGGHDWRHRAGDNFDVCARCGRKHTLAPLKAAKA